MKQSNVLSITIPKDIKLLLEGISEAGYYDSVSEFIRDAIRTFLKENKDLRIALTFQLYKKKKINIAKAAEILEINLKEAKELMDLMES